MFAALLFSFILGNSAYAQSEGPVDLSTPLQERVVGTYIGTLRHDDLTVQVLFNNPDECTEASGRNCNPNVSSPRCQFNLLPLPLKNESGAVDSSLDINLTQENRVALSDYFGRDEADCQARISQWKSRLPNPVQYQTNMIERTWIDWNTYAVPAVCRRNIVHYRTIQAGQLGSMDSQYVNSTSEILPKSVCDKLFNLN